MTNGVESWDLKSFVQMLVDELDQTRDMLRVRSLTRPLTYSVNDLAIELNVFPDYDGDQVRWRTAAPNEAGASKLEFKLGSITDRVVAETTKAPPRPDEVTLDEVSTLDDRTRRSLKRMGIDSKQDVDRMRQQKVRVRNPEGDDVDFERLANMMNEATRKPRRPRVERVLSYETERGPILRLEGHGLNQVRADGVLIDGISMPARVADDRIDVRCPDGPAARECTLEAIDGQSYRVDLGE